MEQCLEQRSRPRPSTQRKLNDIFAAAEVEFLKNGFTASSIEAIASRAQVSKVTIYNYFGDKQTLFTRLFESQISEMGFKYDVSYLEHTSLREILLHASREMMKFLTNEKTIRLDRMLAAEVNRDPEIGLAFLKAGPQAMQSRMGVLLIEALKRGEIRSDDIMASAEMLGGLTMGRLDTFLRYGAKIELTDEEIEKRAQIAVDAWLKIHAV